MQQLARDPTQHDSRLAQLGGERHSFLSRFRMTQVKSRFVDIVCAVDLETACVTSFSCRFNNVDERNAVVTDWEKEYSQTAPCRYFTDVFGRVGPGTLLLGEQYHGSALVNSAAGRNCFYLTWIEATGLRINGSSDWHEDVGVIAPGGEIHAATPAGARAIRLSFFGATLERIQAELQTATPPLQSMLRSGVHSLQVSTPVRTRFRQLLGDLEGRIVQGFAADWSPACQTVIDDNLYSAALAVLLDGQHRPDAGAMTLRARRQLALRAQAVLRDEAHSPITVAGLCAHLGTSERVLELSFQTHFGVSARQFLIAQRLQRAHRALVAVDSPTTVTRVATDFGFWHLSRFSHYYRQMFGVLPSSTLRRQTDDAMPVAHAGDPWRLAIESSTRRSAIA